MKILVLMLSWQVVVGAADPLRVSNPAACFFKSRSPLCFSILGRKM